MDWLSISPDLLVVHYEDVVADSAGELERVHRFIRFPMDAKRIQCIRDNPYNKWKRQKKDLKGFKVDPFEDLHQSFDSAILQVQNELIARGHKLIPIERYLHTKIYL
jgi:hypothetical protein